LGVTAFSLALGLWKNQKENDEAESKYTRASFFLGKFA